MNHRRLRLPAAMALVALAQVVIAAPVLAADQGAGERDAPVANLQRDARELSDTVRHNSIEIGHQVADGVHQARHQFTVQWYRTAASIHHWWDHTRDSVARI
jgi:hypothetical protein